MKSFINKVKRSRTNWAPWGTPDDTSMLKNSKFSLVEPVVFYHSSKSERVIIKGF